MSDIQKAVTSILSFDDFFEKQEKLGKILDKSSSISNEARLEGNQLYNQKNHNQNTHKAILFQYTKSIAFAPRESDELGLAYSNRSALLLHLKRYKESLLDADCALLFVKSDDLKIKLRARQQKCAEILGGDVESILPDLLKNLYSGGEIELGGGQKFDSREKLPKMKPSSVLPCASKSVTLNYNETFGRHLIATQDIKPGKVIIVDKGYVCYPKDNQLYLVCSHCLKFLWNVIPCDLCPFAVYCSKACRSKARKEYHKEECKILLHLNYEKDAKITDVKAIARMLVKVLKKEGLDAVLSQAKVKKTADSHDFGGLLSDGILDSNRFWSCYNLICHTQDCEEKENKKYFYEELVVSLLYRLTDLVANKSNVESFKVPHGDNQYYIHNRFDGKILIQLRDILINLRDILGSNSQEYQAYRCSCSSIDECSEDCDANRGIMISPCVSMLNHSCSPNVNTMFLPKGKIVVFTTAPIKEGEQIFMSYGPVFTEEKKKRFANLKSNFHFTCECTPCKENWLPSSDLKPYVDPKVDAIIQLQIISQLQKSFSNEGTSTFFNEAVDQWKFDKKTLRYIKKWIKLIYDYYSRGEAFIQSLSHKSYIETAFYKLYGEQCIVPGDC